MAVFLFIHLNEKPTENSNQTGKTNVNEKVQLSKFEGQIFFNGIIVDNSNNDVMVDQEKVYLSNILLKNLYGFELKEKNVEYVFEIRRAKIKIADIVKYDDKFYLGLDILAEYISYNHHLFENSGILYMDNMMPEQVVYKDRSYMRTDNQIDTIEFNGSLVETAKDGRGIFKANSDTSIWVEDGLGRIWEYRLPDWGTD